MQRVVASAGGRGRRRGGPGMGGDPQARPRLEGWSSAAAQRTQRVVSPRRKDGRPRWGNQPAGASAEGGASPLGESAHRLLGGLASVPPSTIMLLRPRSLGTLPRFALASTRWGLKVRLPHLYVPSLFSCTSICCLHTIFLLTFFASHLFRLQAGRHDGWWPLELSRESGRDGMVM